MRLLPWLLALLLIASAPLPAHTVIDLDAEVECLADGTVVLSLRATPRVIALMAGATWAARSYTRRSHWDGAFVAALESRLQQDLVLVVDGRRLAPGFAGLQTLLDPRPDHGLLPREVILANWSLPQPLAATQALALELHAFRGQELTVSCSVFYRHGERQWRGLIGSLATAPEVAPAATAASSTAPVRPSAADGVGRVWWQSFLIGVGHIVPYGLDHVAFIAALWLACRRARQVLLTATAFTLAHSLTLGLSLSGVMVPGQAFRIAVEILIAASIVWIAVENLWRRERRTWHFALIAGFGLVHGLGFAGVFSDYDWPSGWSFAVQLLWANLGIEAGQLIVIAGCAAAVGWAWTREWYRARVVIPGSLAVAAIGGWWMVERLLGAMG